jgi:hypothetical protein
MVRTQIHVLSSDIQLRARASELSEKMKQETDVLQLHIQQLQTQQLRIQQLRMQQQQIQQLLQISHAAASAHVSHLEENKHKATIQAAAAAAMQAAASPAVVHNTRQKAALVVAVTELLCDLDLTSAAAVGAAVEAVAATIMAADVGLDLPVTQQQPQQQH